MLCIHGSLVRMLLHHLLQLLHHLLLGCSLLHNLLVTHHLSLLLLLLHDLLLAHSLLLHSHLLLLLCSKSIGLLLLNHRCLSDCTILNLLWLHLRLHLHLHLSLLQLHSPLHLLLLSHHLLLSEDLSLLLLPHHLLLILMTISTKSLLDNICPRSCILHLSHLSCLILLSICHHLIRGRLLLDHLFVLLECFDFSSVSRLLGIINLQVNDSKVTLLSCQWIFSVIVRLELQEFCFICSFIFQNRVGVDLSVDVRSEWHEDAYDTDEYSKYASLSWVFWTT